MTDLVEAIASCDPQDTKRQKELVQEIYKAWEESDFTLRIREGLELIKTYLSPQLSPTSLDAIKLWMDNFQKNLEGQEAPEAVSLKETFCLDNFFMESIFNLGHDFIAQKDFQLAASVFSVLTFLDPLATNAVLSLGLAEAGLGHKESAERAFGAALFLAPHDFVVLYHVGLYYFNEGEKKTAEGFFKLIIEAKESSASLKAYCKQYMGRI